MLRSLVQANAENSSRHNCSTSGAHGHQKRSRKRSWIQSARMNELQQHVEEGMNKESPLELTMGKSNCGNLGNLNNLGNISQSSQDQPNFFTNSQHCEQNLMLPQVLPPVWYFPIYHPSNPSSYGIDPLHFFIYLRVSAHIYDRKTNNYHEITQSYQHDQPHEKERKHDHERNENQIDLNSQKEENSNLNYFKMNEANMQAPTQQLPVSSKSPKTSLSELRNTDLVSRLLAATPPYLYNIPLTPNSYFFSEMLRSLVQAKAENSSRHNCSTSGVHGHQKRSRKRSWTQSARMNELQQHVEEGMNKERPLELTMGKSNCGNLGNLNNLGNISQSSQDQPNFFTSSQPCEQNLMLPPVLPPVWYPPMYHPSNPSPYGIDPLHFFIDLRVSGHIYDRKTNNHQEIMQGYQHGQPHEEERKHDHERNETQIDLNGQKEENSSSSLNYFKVTKHSSAFSVPNQKNPMNLSKFEVAESKTTNTRFDVKSLGFEKNENKIGAHYIMKNVNKIYGEIKAKDDVDKVENKVEIDDDNEEEEREKEKKRVKDLRALIGLELVVDYMEHSKPNGAANKNSSEDSCSTDIDDSADSPSVDVEMCHDDDISSENNA